MFMTGDFEDEGRPLPAPVRAPILPPQPQPAPAPDPNEQAQRAVAAALKLQAQRGYQRDISAGTAPAEALAKWAPSLFGSSPSFDASTPGVPRSASGVPLISPPRNVQWVKNAQPPAPVAPPSFNAPPPVSPPGAVRDVNGQLVRVNPDGSVTALTPPKAAGPSRFDTLEYQSYVNEMRQTEKALDAFEPTDKSPEAKALRDKLSYLRSQAEAVRRRAPQASGVAMQPPAAPVRQGPGTTYIGPRLGARSPIAPPATGGRPTVTTQAQYDALPPGTVYFSKNGKLHRKPDADRAPER